jgi:hypothetical protein
MRVNKAQITGTQGIMEWFDNTATTPYYSVWCGNQLLESWNDKDFDAGRNKLELNLSAFEQNNVGDLLTIKLHPQAEKGFITNKTPVYASRLIRPCELERAVYSTSSVSGINSGLENSIQKLIENQNLILSKLNSDEYNDDEYEKEEENTLGSFIKNPAIQGMMIAGISKFLGLSDVNNVQTGIAGINDTNENAVEILESLMNKGVTIEHLRSLDAMPQSKLSSLLLML